MDYQNVFKRYEIKYMLSEEQYQVIRDAMQNKTVQDKFANSLIRNIYYDTPDYFLIRRSLEKPVYKEKLRLRCYGSADENSKAFIELKKKYKSVVYKRRVAMPVREAEEGLASGSFSKNTQITEEIEYFIKRYEGLRPSIFLSYEREAYKACDGSDLRITFDRNLLWRSDKLSLTAEPYGSEILKPGQVLMELKTGIAIPLWLVKVLSSEKIYKTSFSKYGSVYETALAPAPLTARNIAADTQIQELTKGELIYV